MTTGASPRWQLIAVVLLTLCVVGYIWSLHP
jgi:hypothetical protein